MIEVSLRAGAAGCELGFLRSPLSPPPPFCFRRNRSRCSAMPLRSCRRWRPGQASVRVRLRALRLLLRLLLLLRLRLPPLRRSLPTACCARRLAAAEPRAAPPAAGARSPLRRRCRSAPRTPRTPPREPPRCADRAVQRLACARPGGSALRAAGATAAGAAIRASRAFRRGLRSPARAPQVRQ